MFKTLVLAKDKVTHYVFHVCAVAGIQCSVAGRVDMLITAIVLTVRI